MFTEKTLSALAACAITLGGLATAAPAVAKGKKVVVSAPVSELRTERVTYQDLNLSTPAGETTLKRRVGQAVGEVCRETGGGLETRILENECRGLAWAGARPQIALAVQRGREIAQHGSSAIAPVAISVAFPGN